MRRSAAMNGKTFLFPIHHFRFTSVHHSSLMRLLVRVITGANQRAAGGMAEAHCQCLLLELAEARRLDSALNRKVTRQLPLTLTGQVPF